MNIAILVKMKCKKCKSSSLIMRIVHSKREIKINNINFLKNLIIFKPKM